MLAIPSLEILNVYCDTNGSMRSSGAPRGGSVLKNPPAMQETQVRSLDWEGPLGKEMATHSSILAWEIPWREEPGSPWGLKRAGHNLAT